VIFASPFVSEWSVFTEQAKFSCRPWHHPTKSSRGVLSVLLLSDTSLDPVVITFVWYVLYIILSGSAFKVILQLVRYTRYLNLLTYELQHTNYNICRLCKLAAVWCVHWRRGCDLNAESSRASKLLVGWQEGHPACKTPASATTRDSSLVTRPYMD